MMTLCNCGITLNTIQVPNFHRTIHLVMDVTVGHTYSMQHDFKPNTSREMESGKCRKYQKIYQRQRLAFAPMVIVLFRTMWTGRSTILVEPCRPLCTNNVRTQIFYE